MKRSILVIVIIIVIAAGWYGYTLYTGEVKSLTEVKADGSVGAPALMAAFAQDSAAANRQYLGKIIEVTGNVKAVESDARSATIVLGEAGSLSSVRCSMDSTFVAGATALTKGTSITVKGACTGYMADDLIGSDVILNRCVLMTKK